MILRKYPDNLEQRYVSSLGQSLVPLGDTGVDHFLVPGRSGHLPLLW